jgi:hypothetical protein
MNGAVPEGVYTMPSARLPIRNRLALLTVDNPKIAKGQKAGVLTGVLHLLPAGEYARLARANGDAVVSLTNTCPFAGGCRHTCLNTAGRGGIPMASYAGRAFTNNVQHGRYKRTRMLDTSPAAFVATLIRDVRLLADYARANGYDVAIRLDGTSDLALDLRFPELAAAIADVGAVRYDYTKDAARALASANGETSTRYVYSLDKGAAREAAARRVLGAGGNVAVVFRVKRGRPLPAVWNGYDVVDGDVTDLRYLDPRGTVVGLRAKGSAYHDATGFVREPV